MKLNSRKRFIIGFSVAICLAQPLLQACDSLYKWPENMNDWIDRSVREEVEKLYPIPEECVIVTHVGDTVTMRSILSSAELERFYLEAYSERNVKLDSKTEDNANSKLILRFAQARNARDAQVEIEDKKDYRFIRLTLE